MADQLTLANKLFRKETQMKRLLGVHSFISTAKLKRQFSRFGIMRHESAKDFLQIYLLVLFLHLFHIHTHKKTCDFLASYNKIIFENVGDLSIFSA